MTQRTSGGTGSEVKSGPQPVPLRATAVPDRPPPGGGVNAEIPDGISVDAIVSDLRNGLLQDLVAIGFLLQLTTDHCSLQGCRTDEALRATRELAMRAPETLRRAIERLELH
jgi:hypothetical protein